MIYFLSIFIFILQVRLPTLNVITFSVTSRTCRYKYYRWVFECMALNIVANPICRHVLSICRVRISRCRHLVLPKCLLHSTTDLIAINTASNTSLMTVVSTTLKVSFTIRSMNSVSNIYRNMININWSIWQKQISSFLRMTSRGVN